MPLAEATAMHAEIADDGRALRLQAASGPSLEVDAALLWINCPSALRRRRRIDGFDTTAPADIRVTRVAPIGNYALNIAFSDGHDRGVYPWALIAELATRPKVSDFLIPASDAGVTYLPTAQATTQGCAP